MTAISPISTAPHDGTLIRLHTAPGRAGDWLLVEDVHGWVAYHEDIPLVRYDVTGWEPIVDQAAARAVPLEQVRRAGATTVVVGAAKVPRRQPRQPTAGSWW